MFTISIFTINGTPQQTLNKIQKKNTNAFKINVLDAEHFNRTVPELVGILGTIVHVHLYKEPGSCAHFILHTE